MTNNNFNNNIEAMIALRLIQAQKASDAGKGLVRISLKHKLARASENLGYSFKEKSILEAIKLIRNNKTQFNYWVELAPDQNGVDSIIVYFDFKLNDKRYQISYHNHDCGKELISLVNTGRKTRWNKKYNSVEVCKELQLYYNIPESDDTINFNYNRNRRGRNPVYERHN